VIRKKKEIPLDIPPKRDDVDSWLVVGLDPSLSSTGYAMMKVVPGPGRTMNPTCADGQWLAAGSVRPERAADPIWIRSKMIAVHLREMISKAYDSFVYTYPGSNDEQNITLTEKMGLIISMEFPTPMDDYLVALNRIIHLVFFETDMWKKFATVHILMTNAATLRSLMGLYKKGNNKGENIARAYDFIDKVGYPQLDSDACDAVLLSMVGRHVASILLGFPDTVPDNFKTSLCNAEKGTKGAGRNQKVITKGILHRPEYWYKYTRKDFTLCIRDASSTKKGLIRQQFCL
jgi:hypothetical protein